MNRTELTQKLAAADFVLWDLHLYLDTHPDDLAAVAQYNNYLRQSRRLREEYESTYGKLTAMKAQGVEWLKNPWPWEKCGCDG